MVQFSEFILDQKTEIRRWQIEPDLMRKEKTKIGTK